ncbi:hypothetical protein X281_05650, partial [Oenococcus oeni IOEB_0607]
LEVVGGLMPALGIAMLLNYLGKRSLNAYFIIGFFLAVYLKLDIMAIAIFSAAIAFLIFVSQSRKKSTETQEETKKVRRLTLNNKIGQTAEKPLTGVGRSSVTNPIDYENKLSTKIWLKHGYGNNLMKLRITMNVCKPWALLI